LTKPIEEIHEELGIEALPAYEGFEILVESKLASSECGWECVAKNAGSKDD